MITPIDIQTREFTKVVRGYKEDEVDAFLDLIAGDLEKMIEENLQLREQLKALSVELNRYKSTEGIVLETLEATKALMGDISDSAEKRAEILLKNAELDAELITREARESVERFKDESASLRNSLTIFRTRYRALLESELDKFDNLSTELFGADDLTDLDELFNDQKAFETNPVGKDMGNSGDTKVALPAIEAVAAEPVDPAASESISSDTMVNLRSEVMTET